MIAVRSGKTAAERSRKVSGVSGWKFAGFLSRSRSYGVIGAAPWRRCQDLSQRNRRGKRQALCRHHGAGAVRVVGDEAVDAPIDEPGNVLRRVDGPRDDGKPELLRPAEALLGQVAEGGRPDLAAGTLDESRHGTAEAVDIESGGPGGGAVDALLHGVEMALARQARAGELGRDGFERLEGAPVERLHDHAALKPGRAHRLGDGLSERLGIWRVVAPGGELGLDVEADVVGAGAVRSEERRVGKECRS